MGWYFDLRNCVWKYRLRNGGHFGSAVLTHWCRDKMADLLQTTFSITLYSMTMLRYWLNIGLNFFPGCSNTRHLFRQWFETEYATNHYLSKLCPSSPTYIFIVNRRQCVEAKSSLKYFYAMKHISRIEWPWLVYAIWWILEKHGCSFYYTMSPGTHRAVAKPPLWAQEDGEV